MGFEIFVSQNDGNQRGGNEPVGQKGRPRRFVTTFGVAMSAALFIAASQGCTTGGSAGLTGTASASTPLRSSRIDMPPVADLNTAPEFFRAAQKTAALVTRPSEKAAVLATIAQERHLAGDTSGANETLEQLVRYARSLPNSDIATRQVIWPLVAGTQAALGDIDSARKTATAIKDEHGQSDAWSRIVAGQAVSGDLKGAIATVGKAKFTVAPHQYSALAAIALEAAELGDRRGADIVSRNVEIHWRPKVYLDVADSLRRNGNPSAAKVMLQTALKAVDGIRDPKNVSYENANKTDALISIANLQTSWGEKSAATTTLRRAYGNAGRIGVDSSGRWNLRNDVVGRLVTALVAVGDTKTAAAAASSIKDSTLREAYLKTVKSGNAMGSPGLTPDMENAAVAPKESPVVAQARQGDIAAAKQGIEQVLQPGERAILLAQVGRLVKR